MPYSTLTLALLAEAVSHIAKADGPLIERLNYVDNRWLSTLQPGDLDPELTGELETFRKMLATDEAPLIWRDASDLLVTILIRFVSRKAKSER